MEHVILFLGELRSCGNRSITVVSFLPLYLGERCAFPSHPPFPHPPSLQLFLLFFSFFLFHFHRWSVLSLTSTFTSLLYSHFYPSITRRYVLLIISRVPLLCGCLDWSSCCRPIDAIPHARMSFPYVAYATGPGH